jgi:hypothetical protein
VRPAPSPSRQYARLRDMMVDACMLTTTTRKRRRWQVGPATCCRISRPILSIVSPCFGQTGLECGRTLST